MTKLLAYRTSHGRVLTLARRLGQGGEGSVHAVDGDAGTVVKLYHHPPDSTRQRKLKLMTRLATPHLERVCAWPTATVHDETGRVVGLVMPRVDLADARPIHDLTAPASRLKRYPGADMRFLVLAARNLAAAVATIHAHGQVIGDLNPNNVYVTRKATVILVDTDSFQVTAEGEQYLCTVGMPEFTPPELQGQDLSRAARTPNHDNFALATLVFQLLFLGQYPWAGTYADGRHVPLPDAIRQHHFAWSARAASFGLRPPPAAPPLGMLPRSVADMFETAFGPAAARPTAAAWVAALESLHAILVDCSANPAHAHPYGAPCPWCAVEGASRVTFFLADPRRPARAFPLADAAELWRRIEAVTPARRNPLDVPDLAVPATPRVRQRRARARWLALAALLLALAASFAGLHWGVAALLVLCAVTAECFARTHRGDRRVLLALRRVHADIRAVQEAYAKTEEGTAHYQAVLRELHATRAAVENFSRHEAVLEARVRQEHVEDQVMQGLAAVAITPGVTTGLKERHVTALARRGVRTALDVDFPAVVAAPGVGAKRARDLAGWRAALEAQLKQAASPVLPPSAREALHARVQAERGRLLERLRHGPEALAHAKAAGGAEYMHAHGEMSALLACRGELIAKL